MGPNGLGTHSIGSHRFHMDADRRRLLYEVAAGTGFRLSELACLSTSAVVGQHILLPGTVSKNGQDIRQPIAGDLAAKLSALPEGQIFPLLHKGATFLRDDLEAASVPYRDERNRVRDFHSLRSLYVHRLIRAGIPINLVQRLARHSTPSVTLKHYLQVTGDTEMDAAIDAAFPIS